MENVTNDAMSPSVQEIGDDNKLAEISKKG